MHRATLAIAATLLSGCVVVPRTADVYDEQCRTYVKQVVLETEVIGAIGHCRGDECAVMLATAGVVAAVSAVISGSVAIIGNIAYWAERGGQCPGPGAGAGADRKAARATTPAPTQVPQPPGPSASTP